MHDKVLLKDAGWVTTFLALPPNDNSRRRKPLHSAFPPYSRKLINYQLRDSYRLSICIELIINSNISIQERQQCGARELLGSHWKHPNKCSYWAVRQELQGTAWARHRHSRGHRKRLCNTCAGYCMFMRHRVPRWQCRGCACGASLGYREAASRRGAAPRGPRPRLLHPCCP